VAEALTDYARDYATWAGTALPGTPVHTGPASHDRTIAHLHLFTEDGLPEVYQVIAQEIDKYGTTWVHIAVPMRPNGVTGWVPADDLTPFTTVHALLLVNLTARQITLFKNGKVAFRAPVGVGKPSTPTPPGRFWVREKFPVNPPVPLYGPYAIGTSDYSTTETDWPGGGIIGIHGTDEPSLIPGDPSHGCVRLQNPDITKLYKLVQIGTPIVII
jgi:lipoprotein-anchoring transpeptidase ErfK/SrfK